MRVFVGSLFAVGLFVYLCKGYRTLENWALNIAGVCAIGVALVTTAKRGAPSTAFTNAHGAFAIALFLCIAYVAIFRAVDTLSLLKDSRRTKSLRRAYRVLGFGMAISPLLAVPLTFTVSKDGSSIVFFLEAVGVEIFAIY
jgi:hypothetical protein